MFGGKASSVAVLHRAIFTILWLRMLDINTRTQHNGEATEVLFLRRMMRVSWTEKKNNDEVLGIANGYGNMIIFKTRTRQA